MTSTTETPVSCPPSAVHDTITTWGDRDHVAPGDLVVHERMWAIVASIDVIAARRGEPGWFWVLLEGGPRFRVHEDDLVAVRRYDTREDR